jgi:pyruvate-ferredoxin/flavodoxin oxidoreductase
LLKKVDNNRPHFVKTIADEINSINGYALPVSAFTGYEDGTMPNGSAAYEKRAREVVPLFNDQSLWGIIN